ncbi:hypothetical protein HK101_001805, partial [Irineochytrium annulatum]
MSAADEFDLIGASDISDHSDLSDDDLVVLKSRRARDATGPRLRSSANNQFDVDTSSGGRSDTDADSFTLIGEDGGADVGRDVGIRGLEVVLVYSGDGLAPDEVSSELVDTKDAVNKKVDAVPVVPAIAVAEYKQQSTPVETSASPPAAPADLSPPPARPAGKAITVNDDVEPSSPKLPPLCRVGRVEIGAEALAVKSAGEAKAGRSASAVATANPSPVTEIAGHSTASPSTTMLVGDEFIEEQQATVRRMLAEVTEDTLKTQHLTTARVSTSTLPPANQVPALPSTSNPAGASSSRTLRPRISASQLKVLESAGAVSADHGYSPADPHANPLMLACASGDSRVVEKLLGQCDPNACHPITGATALDFALDRCDCLGLTCALALFRDGRLPVDTETTSKGSTALMCAAEIGDVGTHSVLLNVYGAVPGRKSTRTDLSAMDHAVRAHPVTKERLECVVALIKAGLDANSTDVRNGSTAAMFLAQAGDVKGLREVLGRGADPGYVNAKTSKTAMDYALDSSPDEKRLSCVVELIKAGADVNRRDMRHGQLGYFNTVKLLLGLGADAHVENASSKWTAIDFALQNPNLNQVKSAVELIRTGGVDPNRKTVRGVAAIHVAARCGCSNELAELVALGANPTARCSAGKLAADYALESPVTPSKISCVVHLVGAGLPVDHRETTHGSTALMHATQIADIDGVRALLELGADLTLPNPNSGRIAADFALEARPRGSVHLASVVELIRARPETVDRPCHAHSSTVLMHAAQTGDLKAVDALLALGANPAAANARTHWTSLDFALQDPHNVPFAIDTALRLLRTRKVDVDHPVVHTGSTALMYAAQRGEVAAVRELLALGADAKRVNVRRA